VAQVRDQERPGAVAAQGMVDESVQRLAPPLGAVVRRSAAEPAGRVHDVVRALRRERGPDRGRGDDDRRDREQHVPHARRGSGPGHARERDSGRRAHEERKSEEQFRGARERVRLPSSVTPGRASATPKTANAGIAAAIVVAAASSHVRESAAHATTASAPTTTPPRE